MTAMSRDRALLPASPRASLRMKSANPLLPRPLRSPAVDLRIVRLDHHLRAETEAHIREIYAAAYGAQLDDFPETLVAGVAPRGVPLVAAGLRTADTGYFSEVYLDRPIEAALGAAVGRTVERARVLEIVTLASRSADVTVAFLRRLAACAEFWGFDWAFFTATERLRDLLCQLGLPLIPLADADPARVGTAASWGSYYRCHPCVYAVARRRFMFAAPVLAVENGRG